MRHGSRLWTFALVVLGSVLLQAQTTRPTPVAVSGVVVTPTGEPVSGTRLDYGATFDAPLTDARGQFTFTTTSPLVVVRKLGFVSQRVRLTGDTPLRLTLLPAQPTGRTLPACSAAMATACKKDRFGGSFCFPPQPGVKPTKPTRDADYSVRGYIVKTPSGKAGFQHGHSLSWSNGIPSATQIRDAVGYEEVIYDRSGGIELVDARGTTAAGKHWRFLGQFGETATYMDLDAASAARLNRVLDTLCFLNSCRATILV